MFIIITIVIIVTKTAGKRIATKQKETEERLPKRD